MIKNLVVNGCSFTNEDFGNTWATFLSQSHCLESYYNKGAPGAGNYYICNSTINFLEEKKFNPDETMIMIMWSGTGRKDLNITAEWWHHLKNDRYHSLRNHNDKHHYVFSGGVCNSWRQNKITKEIFEWHYKLSNPTILCLDSLMNFINLENYLKVHKYQYKFTSYFNYWSPTDEINQLSGDYSIGYFCKDLSIYQNYDFSNWVFVNDQFDSLGEFANNMNALDKSTHPLPLAHEKFVEKIILPSVKNVNLTSTDSCVMPPVMHN